MLAYLVSGREVDSQSVDPIIPYVGRHRGAPRVLPEGGRLIKSHERYATPHGSSYRRAVYVVRDGRDVAVSYYDWQLRKGLYGERFDQFLRLFLAGRLDGYGAWHQHVRSWLTSPLAQEDGLLVIRYEDLLEQPQQHLARVAQFVGLEASRKQVEEAVSRNTMERARARYRRLRHSGRPRRREAYARPRGESGTWRRIFTPRDLELFKYAAGETLDELGYPDGLR